MVLARVQRRAANVASCTVGSPELVVTNLIGLEERDKRQDETKVHPAMFQILSSLSKLFQRGSLKCSRKRSIWRAKLAFFFNYYY